MRRTNVAFDVMAMSEISDIAGSNIPDTAGRKTRRRRRRQRRRTQAIVKRYAFYANVIKCFQVI